MAEPAAKPAIEGELVWQYFGRRNDGFFIDVGANEPKAGSQSWLLEQQGWSGILVEPLSRLCAKLRIERLRSRVFQVACGAGGHPAEMPLFVAEARSKSSLAKHLIEAGTKYVATEMVKVMTLDEILEEEGNPCVDFVSIDVEGTQMEVLRGFSLERHHPGLVLIEDHLHNLSVHRYLSKEGYRLVKRTGLNNWYVPKQSQFELSTGGERIRLWKKVWANTPFRKLRVFLEHRRAARQNGESHA